jgi:dynein heavy chain
MFRATMSKVLTDPHAIVVMNDENLLSTFSEAHKLLDSVQKGLNDYLETKRAVFPRFFFLSNDELLDILAETRDPKRVIPHLPKCFEGICDVSCLDFHLHVLSISIGVYGFGCTGSIRQQRVHCRHAQCRGREGMITLIYNS